MFPTRKIAMVGRDDGQDIAEALARTIVYFRTQRQPIEELKLSSYPMEDLSYDELVEQFYEIWNPDNFELFQSEEVETLDAADRLARYILPEHVQLVA